MLGGWGEGGLLDKLFYPLPWCLSELVIGQWIGIFTLISPLKIFN